MPAKPTGLLPGRSHDRVLLFWDDPDDDTITGYQVLRGDDADNLAVLTGDTGSAASSYTDDSVTAETTYVYTIRARNAGGLGPQSDTVSVTTQAAPEELVTEEQVAGVDFIIAGQMMDTTGTCSEDDIALIGDDCTHDITNPMPQFGVLGTLDTDDRVSVRIGRDLAGLTDVADQSDLQGPNKRIRLDLQPGRNLLRIWGDENNDPGGSEQHFFRVNVVPYWELNGERLSKDSACRSATARTAAQITDSKCILTTFKGGSFSFHNVLSDHFNAYVDVNTVRQVDTPDDAALANPFPVTLDDGENVVRVRLAAKGSQPQGEVYDSDAFYYKVTGTDVAVSNLGQVSNHVPGQISNNSAAVSFTTGGNPDGYNVSAVRLSASISDTNSVPQVSVYSNISGEPGSSLKVLTNPASIPVSATPATEVEFGAGNYRLAANTTYWIVLDETSASGRFHFDMTTSTSEDADGAPGWEIGDSMLSFQSGSWATFSGGFIAQFAVKGAPAPAVSDDATLSDLVLFDSKNTRVTLDPAFDSEVTEYTATVANEHTRGALDAQLNDVKAEVEFLDKDDATIPTVGMAGDVRYINPNFEVGDNIFKIKVTAEDGTTTKTYVVTVTRVDFLVSNLGLEGDSGHLITTSFPAHAVQFTTGGEANGYDIKTVVVRMSVDSGNSAKATIYSDSSGLPGSILKVLDSPSNFPEYDERVDFDAGNYKLKPGTYWVVIERVSGTGNIIISGDTSTSEDPGTEAGWSIGNRNASLTSGAWVHADDEEPLLIAVKGETFSGPSAPDAPASLSVTPGDAQATLTWTAPASDGGAAITKYQYRVSADGGSNWAPDWTDVPDGSDPGSDQADERSVTITSLANGTLHTFQVRAVNSEGSGGEVEATATPTATTTAPGAPASLAATRGDTEVDLRWTPPASDGGAAIVKYQYRVSVDGGSNWAPDWTDVPDGSDAGTDLDDERTLMVTNLINGTLYTFQVRAVNSVGSGGQRQTTATPGAAGTPPDLQSAEIDGAELTLEFSNTLDETSRPARSAFTVKVRGAAVSLSSSNPVSISGSTVTLRLRSAVTAGDTVTVSYTAPGANPIQDAAALEAPSFTEEPVTNNTPNAAPTGKPVISGTPQRDETLTVLTSGIRDDDGLSNPGYSYRWVQVDGATETALSSAPSYLLIRDDIGKKIKVTVHFQDDAGKVESLESDLFPRSGTIQNKPNRQPTGRPTLSGTYQVGHTLTADTSGIGDQDGLTSPDYTYQWQRRESGIYTDITGATAMVYTLTADDQGKRVRVQVTFTDDDDTLNDDGETITLCLVDLPDPYAVLAGRDCATINILDNDDPNSVQVSFDRGNYWASEDGNPAWPRITVHPVPDREITIPITVTPGGGLSAADHGAVTTSVTFGPGLYGVHGDGHLSDNRTYASFPIEIWAIDDDVDDDDGEYLDLAFGRMPDAFVTEDTGYRLGGDSRAGFRRPANKSRVWFNDNEFTQVSVTDPPNPLGLSRRMRVTFADAELEAKEGLYEIGTVATVRVQMSRPRNKEHGSYPHHRDPAWGHNSSGLRRGRHTQQHHLPARSDRVFLPRESGQRRHRR